MCVDAWKVSKVVKNLLHRGTVAVKSIEMDTNLSMCICICRVVEGARVWSHTLKLRIFPYALDIMYGNNQQKNSSDTSWGMS